MECATSACLSRFGRHRDRAPRSADCKMIGCTDPGASTHSSRIARIPVKNSENARPCGTGPRTPASERGLTCARRHGADLFPVRDGALPEDPLETGAASVRLRFSPCGAGLPASGSSLHCALRPARNEPGFPQPMVLARCRPVRPVRPGPPRGFWPRARTPRRPGGRARRGRGTSPHSRDPGSVGSPHRARRSRHRPFPPS